MKICVIGAGVSGLSFARMVQKKGHEVTVFEASSKIGGIAMPREVAGMAYHVTGGHCFNSKFEDVLDFVFDVLPKDQWNKIERRAKIYFKDHFVGYPIEFALKEIYEFDPEFVVSALADLLSANDTEPENLAEWFRIKFGNSLAEAYFIPYNRKIWNEDPAKMSSSWVNDKLPLPNKKQIIHGILRDEKDSMPHAFFYYPKSNSQATFLEALSNQVKIEFNQPVKRIEKTENGGFEVNSRVFDRVISTAPLNEVPSFFSSIPESVVEAAKKLRYNQVTTMLWRSKPTENTWTYFPSASTIFHRHIHIGNFFRPAADYIITEAVGFVDRSTMEREGRRFAHLIEPIDYHVSKHAYVVYDDDYAVARSTVMDYVKHKGIDVLGRFGEWEYYNMDVCIKSAIELAKKYNN